MHSSPVAILPTRWGCAKMNHRQWHILAQKGREAAMKGNRRNLWTWLEWGLWFALSVGLMARLGDEMRAYAVLRQQRLDVTAEVERLQRKVQLLQNKLHYLQMPDGIRLAQRLHGVASKGEKVLIFIDDKLPPIDIVEFLPGGLEEWHAERHQPLQDRNRWLKRLSRHWQSLQGRRWR